MQVALHQRALQQPGIGGDAAEVAVARIHQHVHQGLDGAEHHERGHGAGDGDLQERRLAGTQTPCPQHLQHHQRGGNA
ncbi:hypothetical protein D3C71_2074240 [compost metagenome]